MEEHRAVQCEEDDASSSDDASDSQPGSSESDSDVERELEARVAEIPFEVLEKLKQDGTGLTGLAAKQMAAKAKRQEFHRDTKNRPSEMSSKRPVSRFKDVLQAPKM